MKQLFILVGALVYFFTASDYSPLNTQNGNSAYQFVSAKTQTKQIGNRDYIPDNNPTTWDEDPTNYPLEKPRVYRNVENIEVQSPTSYNAIPEGACAVCKDGSYSFSRHRRGTCSGHGGVYKWLKNIPN